MNGFCQPEKRLHVLVVSGNAPDRDLYRRLLNEENELEYQLTEASTGEEGLDCYKRLRPDCLLLDFGLPGIDGLEFLDELREGREEALLPVVMVTDRGNQSAFVEAMKKGAKDYLVKDRITADSLRRALRHTAERVALLRELKDKTCKLEEIRHQWEEFAHLASHDLQEPLRKISNFAGLLASRYKEQLDSRAGDYIEYIVDGATRMQQLIEELLIYSLTGREKIVLASVDLNLILEQALDDLGMMISDTRAQVTHDPLPMCRADATQVRRLFQNLISNAIKYRSDTSPRVHISSHEGGNNLKISVQDNGIGIDPRFSKRIFGLFQRLHTRQEYPGTGIGLATCKRIVERHGGRIWMESQPGKGSTFFFTLPYKST